MLLVGLLLFMMIKFPRTQWISFILSSLKSSLIQSFSITFLSPILKTLTESYADDTICLLVTSKYKFSGLSLLSGASHCI